MSIGRNLPQGSEMQSNQSPLESATVTGALRSANMSTFTACQIGLDLYSFMVYSVKQEVVDLLSSIHARFVSNSSTAEMAGHKG